MSDDDGHSIEDMAEPEGDVEGDKLPSRRMTAAEIAERDKELVRDRLRGMTWAKIADKYGITDRGAQKAFERWRDNEAAPKFQSRDPINFVYESLARFEAWIEQLAEIAMTAENDSNRIGAINSQMAALSKAIDLAQATGMLPKELGKLRVEMDVRMLATKIIAIFDEHDVPDEARVALMEALGG